MNQVTLVGRLSKAPRKVGDGYAFPLALFSDGDGHPTAFAPIVALEPLPDGLAYRPGDRLTDQALLRVTGYLRTRNRTPTVRDDVRSLLVRAGLEDRRLVRSLVRLIPPGLRARHVEVEVVAEEVRVETEVHELADPAGHAGG